MKQLTALFVGVSAVHVLLLIGLGMSGGCRSPKVLRNRTYIPAQPPPAVEPVSPPVATPPVADPFFDLAYIPPAPELDPVIKPLVIPFDPVDPVSELPPLPPIETKSISYTVQKGDSFWKIARKFGVSMRELAAFNNMSLDKPLRVGSTINVPPGGVKLKDDIEKTLDQALPPPPLTMRQPAATPPAPSGADTEYIVERGDSLWKIAVRHNLRTETLASANNLDIKKPLQLGQRLVIPGGAAKPAATTSAAAPPPKPTPAVQPPPATRPSPETSPAPPATTRPITVEDEFDIDSLNLDSLGATASGDDLDDFVTRLLEGDTVLYGEHEVLRGETWESLAKQYNTTVQRLKSVNPGRATGELKPGMVIKIP